MAIGRRGRVREGDLPRDRVSGFFGEGDSWRDHAWGEVAAGDLGRDHACGELARADRRRLLNTGESVGASGGGSSSTRSSRARTTADPCPREAAGGDRRRIPAEKKTPRLNGGDRPWGGSWRA